MSAMTQAVLAGHVEILRLMLACDRKHQFNNYLKPDSKGMLLLHLALYQNRVDIAKVLLVHDQEQGRAFNVNQENAAVQGGVLPGTTMKERYIGKNAFQIMHMKVGDNGISLRNWVFDNYPREDTVDSVDNLGNSFVHIHAACSGRQHNVVGYLLQLHPDGCKAKTTHGLLPIMNAISNSNTLTLNVPEPPLNEKLLRLLISAYPEGLLQQDPRFMKRCIDILKAKKYPLISEHANFKHKANEHTQENVLRKALLALVSHCNLTPEELETYRKEYKDLNWKNRKGFLRLRDWLAQPKKLEKQLSLQIENTRNSSSLIGKCAMSPTEDIARTISRFL